MFTSNFKHSLLFYSLTGKNKPQNPSDFRDKFLSCLASDSSTNRHYNEWRDKLNKEMSIFNGKIALDKNEAETNSTTSASTTVF